MNIHYPAYSIIWLYYSDQKNCGEVKQIWMLKQVVKVCESERITQVTNIGKILKTMIQVKCEFLLYVRRCIKCLSWLWQLTTQHELTLDGQSKAFFHINHFSHTSNYIKKEHMILFFVVIFKGISSGWCHGKVNFQMAQGMTVHFLSLGITTEYDTCVCCYHQS